MAKKDKNIQEGYEVFKGLQSPLVFKGFKGRFIYIGAGIFMGGFILSAIFITTLGTIAGIIVLCIVWSAGYVYITKEQKKGLHKKNIKKGIFIVVNKYELKKLD